MAKRLRGTDHDLKTRFDARRLLSGLCRALPAAWCRHLDTLAAHPDGEPVWLRAPAWLERLEAFKVAHGDAAGWHQADIDLKAKELAGWVSDLLDLKTDTAALAGFNGDALDVVRLDKVLLICDHIGVDYPAAITAAGAVNRALSHIWWRRVLRVKVARVVEAGAIKLNLVNRRDGGYCSDGAVRLRQVQQARNAAMLEATLVRNEAGQVFKLSELAKSSTANPEIRGGELMVRIRGCEEFADKAGHVGYFLTGTCPSKFHAVQVMGKGPRALIQPNPKYDGASTPRDAQAWLREQWAKVRAQWARDGVKSYGFRVAEPHHDGCPHWHLLLWFETEEQARGALATFGRKWLSDGGAVLPYPVPDKRVMVYSGAPGAAHEKGALTNRVNIKRMIGGGAAGYVAKYIAKSIGHFDVGVQLDQADGKTWAVDTREVKGWQRVDAWAATWGIRQFQAIGQPSVTVWRELRRVTKDQIESAIHGGDQIASRAWHAVHKFGDTGADWCRYMVEQGGAALKRAQWQIKTAIRETPDYVNQYGETLLQKKVIGCRLKSGRVLVSRRQSWAHVGAEVGIQESGEREALGAPWTRFNNCTARLGHSLRAALLGLKNFTDGGPVYGLGVFRVT